MRTRGYRTNVSLFSLILTIAVTLAVVVAILLFEKKRAQQIERDVSDMARGRDQRDERPPDQ